MVTHRIENRQQYEFAMARIYELCTCEELTQKASVELQGLSNMVETYEESAGLFQQPIYSQGLNK